MLRLDHIPIYWFGVRSRKTMEPKKPASVPATSVVYMSENSRRDEVCRLHDHCVSTTVSEHRPSIFQVDNGASRHHKNIYLIMLQ